jgi:hypothetical protein
MMTSKKVAAAPNIAVPTITLEGGANGTPHPRADAYRKKFSHRYACQLIKGGAGHNLPQEAQRPLPMLSSTSPKAPLGDLVRLRYPVFTSFRTP